MFTPSCPYIELFKLFYLKDIAYKTNLNGCFLEQWEDLQTKEIRTRFDYYNVLESQSLTRIYTYKQKIYINKEKEYWVSKNDRKKLVIEQIKNRGRKDKKNTD